MGQRLSEHPDVRKLGFTGSTPIGKQIMKRYRPEALRASLHARTHAHAQQLPVFSVYRSCAVSNLKKVSLELGGKSPLIIFSDCDMDKAVRMVRKRP